MKRVADYIPKLLIDQLLPLGRMNPPWATIKILERPHFQISLNPGAKIPAMLKACITSSSDLCSLLGMSKWLADGPKIIQPSLEDCKALCEVEVSIDPLQYRQPYQAVMTKLPPGFTGFHACLLFHPQPEVLVLVLMRKQADIKGPDYKHDIVTMIRLEPDSTIETSITTFDAEVKVDQLDGAVEALRVGLNLCLLMTHYGTKIRAALPKELEDNKSLLKRGGNVAQQAQLRIDTAVHEITFDQEVKLFSVSETCNELGEQHASPKPHWRKGHWRSRPVHKELGLVFVRPVFVRGHAFPGDKSDTSATYS